MRTSTLLLALVGSFVSVQAGGSDDGTVSYGASDPSLVEGQPAKYNGKGSPQPFPGADNDSYGQVSPQSDDDNDNDDEYPSNCVTTLYHPATQTITATTTSTWCPICDEARNNGGVYTTTYETVYESVCPTGLTSVTYLVTQECTGTTEIDTATCPPGFVETTTACDACEGSTPVTITVPCPVCKVTPAAYDSNVLAVQAVQTPSANVAAASGDEGTGAAPGADVAAASASPSSTAGANVAAASYQPFEGKAASSAITGLLTVGAGFGSVFLAMLLL